MRITEEMPVVKEARLRKESDAAQKIQDIVDNLPSWDAVETTINNISRLADAKAFLLKLSKIVYWLAKNESK